MGWGWGGERWGRGGERDRVFLKTRKHVLFEFQLGEGHSWR